MAQEACDGKSRNVTTLHIPTWYGGIDEIALPLEEQAYAVARVEPDRWTVTVISTGEVVYRSIGPVMIVETDVPF